MGKAIRFSRKIRQADISDDITGLGRQPSLKKDPTPYIKFYKNTVGFIPKKTGLKKVAVSNNAAAALLILTRAVRQFGLDIPKQFDALNIDSKKKLTTTHDSALKKVLNSLFEVFKNDHSIKINRFAEYADKKKRAIESITFHMQLPTGEIWEIKSPKVNYVTHERQVTSFQITTNETVLHIKLPSLRYASSFEIESAKDKKLLSPLVRSGISKIISRAFKGVEPETKESLIERMKKNMVVKDIPIVKTNKKLIMEDDDML